MGEARRDEIHQFLKERFTQYRNESKEATKARLLNSMLHCALVLLRNVQCKRSSCLGLWCKFGTHLSHMSPLGLLSPASCVYL